MPFRFRKSESPAKAVRRVCRERIGAARERLRGPKRPAAVHEVRRETKKLRALFRLVRGGARKEEYRQGVRALRKAAAGLTAPRDAQVRLKAFQKLTDHSAEQFTGIERVLRKHCRRETRRLQKNHSVAMANGFLRKAGRRAGRLKIKTAGWAAIEPGLRRSYRRGREAWEQVRRVPSPENFHEWRKRVKDLWHHFRLLSPAWSAAMRARTGQLELLGTYLGDDHDLVLLQEFIAENCDGRNREVRALNRLIKLRQKALRAAALKLGARLYAEAPALLCRRVRDCWKSWRGEDGQEE